VVTQYPHIATVILTTDGGRDGKGYPLPPVETIITLICRAEVNTSNAIINTADGSTYNFKYVVYIKAGQTEIPVSSRVTQIATAGTGLVIFTDDGQPIVTEDIGSPLVTEGNGPGPYLSIGIVKMYSKGQFNARLWL
jgi:hypothetical protein